MEAASKANHGPPRRYPPSQIEGTRFALLSLSLNLFLAFGKYLLYLHAGSTAVLAEAVHSITDVVGSLLVIGGIFLSEKKSRGFPWGLYKIENLAAVLSAALIFPSAYKIASIILRPSPDALRNLHSTMVALLLMTFPIVLFLRYNAFSELEKGKGIRLAEFLVTMKVDVLFSKEVFEGTGPAYVFAEAGIEIRTDEQAKRAYDT